MTAGIAPEPGDLPARDARADVRARETEEQMSDEERFALIVNLTSAGLVELASDERIPDDAPSTPRVPGFNLQLAGRVNLTRVPAMRPEVTDADW